MKISDTEKRKVQHIDIVLNEDIRAHNTTNGLDSIVFDHYALPEIDYAKIDSSVTVFKKKLKAPFLISSMTGGASITEKINKELAAAAEQEGVAMGLGSMRAMIEKPELARTYNVRGVAPNILLFGNIGAFQLKKYKTRQIEKACKDVGADAVFIHLNPLQEAVQPEGDKDWTGVLRAIENFCEESDLPVAVKEVGAGINAEVAEQLERAGVQAIDVAGVGGTSWSAIEQKRKGGVQGETFREWGVPTVDALTEVKKAVMVPVFASGGITNGLEAAKCVRLGATLVGAGFPFIHAQNKDGKQGVVAEIKKWKEELRTAMFLTRSKNLNELAKAKLRSSI
ncbi:MAG TPA: type 2 isopentenyl-diphosphate Delta-isomerase [Candidatus Norongarragalinales archaeon]|nr:type 2 isopentenyl-diphosphate Delta-isomerase [Candidatus Norongarragalinales archaeon]